MAATPEEVQAAQKYLATKGIKLRPHRFAAAHKELGYKDFDDTLNFLRMVARGASDQEEELKERVEATVPTYTREDLLDYLEALREHAVRARSRLPELFQGGSDIRKVTPRVEEAAAAGVTLSARQLTEFAHALRRAAAACEFCYDVAYGFEIWTVNEIAKLKSAID